MNLSDNNTSSLQRKVEHYREVLGNTVSYRESWHSGLKQRIISQLKTHCEAVGLNYGIEERSEVEQLEAIVLSLGSGPSGLREKLTDGQRRDLIKQNGSLMYQQLFNGKILVIINLPFIEKYGQPQPPKTIAIYRPHELLEPYLMQHLETFISDVTAWEDYDDEATEVIPRIGFKTNAER